MHFWLSFADPDRPKGDQFLGATLIEADDAMDAVRKAWKAGLNPGGEVLIGEVPDDILPTVPDARGKLMTKEELNERGIYSNYDKNIKRKQ
jgi:hypothetical protein